MRGYNGHDRTHCSLAEGDELSGEGNSVTRDVEPAALRDLLAHPVRATVAFVGGDGVDLVPVRARCAAGSYLFGVAAGAAPDVAGREVVLVIDDGRYWFELRGVSVRGAARRIDSPGETDGLSWYAIAARRVLAWDYGTIREQ
jgi:hypothetical protein